MTARAVALARRVGTADPVLAAMLAIVAALALAAPPQAAASVQFVGRAFASILPYLVLSVLVAATVQATGFGARIAQVFSGHPRKAVVAAAVFGAISPLCSCGVVPMIAALLVAGVPVAPVMSFWIASPLMSPAQFILTSAEFSFEFAMARLVSAIALGLLAGAATLVLVRRGRFGAALRPGISACGSCGPSPASAAAPVAWRFLGDPDRRHVFRAEAATAAWFLIRWLGLAFLVESLMVAYLPAGAIGAWLGGEAWWSIPAGVAAGAPAYLNGYAAIPTVARLMEMGMAPGAALAFLTAGAVTSIPAAMAVFALVRRGLFAWYLALGVSGSLVAGYAFQAWAG